MAYKKTEAQEKAGAKPRKPRFDTFPKVGSTEEKKSKKQHPYGQSGANYFEKKKKKPLREDELPASRGFPKSKTGYNNPNAPWNREKKVEKKPSYGEDRPRTFQPKWLLRDPTQEVEHENNPANYGAAKLQFRRVSKRAQRSFSKNKERAYEEQKGLQWDTPTLKTSSKPYEKIEKVEEKKKFQHGKGKPLSKWPATERLEKPKEKKKHNPKPFKAAMPSNWRKVGE